MKKNYNELKEFFINYYFNVLAEDVEEVEFINYEDVRGLIFENLI